MQNSDFRTRHTSVYGSQTTSVVLSTPNSVLSTRIKRQYGFQPSPVVLFMQTATLALELLVSIVPSSHLWFLHAKQRLLDPNSKSLWVPVITCRFCDCNAARLAPELLVPMGPSPYLRFSVQKSDFWSRITRLYGTQTTPVVLCMQERVISTWITSLYGSLPSSVVIACKTANIGPKYKSLWVPDITCRFVHAKRRDLHQNDKITWVPTLICGFVLAKQRL